MDNATSQMSSTIHRSSASIVVGSIPGGLECVVRVIPHTENPHFRVSVKRLGRNNLDIWSYSYTSSITKILISAHNACTSLPSAMSPLARVCTLWSSCLIFVASLMLGYLFAYLVLVSLIVRAYSFSCLILAPFSPLHLAKVTTMSR